MKTASYIFGAVLAFAAGVVVGVIKKDKIEETVDNIKSAAKEKFETLKAKKEAEEDEGNEENNDNFEDVQ